MSHVLDIVDSIIGIIDREERKENDNYDNYDGLNLSSDNKNISCKLFGKTKKGEIVDIYTLRNDIGMEVEIINYGGHIRCLRVPSKKLNGKLIDVVIGLDNMQDYENKNKYFGSIVGRFANRICKGKFSLNNKEYNLAINNGPNSLHGGIDNFSKKIWKVTILKNEIGINLNYFSKDGEEGFPADLNINIKYILSKTTNELDIKYEAKNESNSLSTIINLTNHSYFNLNGDFTPNSILNNKSHSFQINADYFIPIDKTSIPLSSSLMNVVNTPFDFRKPINNLDEIIFNKIKNQQIINGNGIDHTFVINGYNDDNKSNLNECAVIIGNNTNIKLIISTSEPGVQFYTANYLNGTMFGKNKLYDKRCAFCLETQHFPDSPNRKTFPSTALKNGQTFTSMTKYAFV